MASAAAEPFAMSLPSGEAAPVTTEDGPRGGADSTALLQRFWGAEWPAVQVELATAGFDLENLPPIWPWEEAEPMLDWYLTLTAPDRIEMVFGGMFRWPNWHYQFGGRACSTPGGQWHTDGEFLEQETSLKGARTLTEEDTRTILARVAPVNRELEQLLLDYIANLEVLLRQKLHAGAIERAPLRLRPVKRRPQFGTSLYGVRPSMMGWQITDSLVRSEAPDLAELSDRIERLKEERAALTYTLVSAHLHALD